MGSVCGTGNKSEDNFTTAASGQRAVGGTGASLDDNELERMAA